MRKVFAVIAIMALLMGCTSEPYYVNVLVESDTSSCAKGEESYEVTSYNGYRLKDKTETKNEDGSIIITLEFVPPENPAPCDGHCKKE